MEGESGVTRSIIDALRSSDIQQDQREDESGVTRSIIDKLHSLDIRGDQKEGKSGVTRSIIDEPHSRDIQGYQMERESMLLLEVKSMNIILGICKQIKWKMKLMLLEV